MTKPADHFQPDVFTDGTGLFTGVDPDIVAKPTRKGPQDADHLTTEDTDDSDQ